MSALGLVVLALLGPRAEASDCSPAPPRRDIRPDPGAVDVPRNVDIHIRFRGPWAPGTPARHASEVRLRGPDGDIVPTDIHVSGNVVTLDPVADLAPGSRYVLERVSDWDAQSGLLLDSWWVPPVLRDGPRPADRVRRAWAPDAAFTTGAWMAGGAPGEPEVVGARVSNTSPGSRGGGESLVVPVRPPVGFDRWDQMEVEVSGLGVVADALGPRVAVTDPDARPWGFVRSDRGCQLPHEHTDWHPFLWARAHGVGPGGVRSTGSWSWVRPPEAWPDAAHAERTRRRAAREASAPGSGHEAAPIVSSARAAPGPTGCPHGLEVHDWTRFGSVRWGWGLVTLGEAGLRVLAADAADSMVQRVRLDTHGVREVDELLPRSLGGRVAWAADGEAVISIARGTEVRRLGGEHAWARTLPQWRSLEGRPAVGPDRVLIVGRGEDRATVGWSVLDVATGSVVAPDVRLPGPAESVRVDDVEWDGAGFRVSWTRSAARGGEREQLLTRVDPEGQPVRTTPLAHPLAAIAAVGSGGGSVAVDWVHSKEDEPGGPRVLWLDERDRLVGEPIRLPGRGVVDAVGAWGELAVVVSSVPFQPLRVTVVDAAGRIAPWTTVPQGGNGQRPWIAIGEAGPMLAFGVGVSGRNGAVPVVAELRCRATPPTARPSRIAG